MADSGVRRATRLARPSWLDPRLLLGVLLILVSVVLGARIFASADHESSLYVAAHPLVPGERLTAADLTVGRARLDGQGSAYLAAGTPPTGYVVLRYVGAGELLPARAIAPPGKQSNERLVTLPVAPGHLPPDVGPGTLVDLYETPKSGGAGTPVLVASSVPVQQRVGGTSSLEGTTVLSVVVSVPDSEVAAVVKAAETGSIDLVQVPDDVVASLPAATSAPITPPATSTGGTPAVSRSATPRPATSTP